MNFSTYNCSSLENFFVAAANSENVFGIFFIPDSVLESIPSIFPGFSFEIITSVQSTLITSYKNTSPITKKNSVTLDEVAKLPLIRCFGSNLAIQENLYDTQFSYCMDVANAQYVSVILNKRPELYCLGTNIFLSVESKKSISIPIIDAPLINLVLITKNNEENDDVFSRLSTILRSLYMH